MQPHRLTTSLKPRPVASIELARSSQSIEKLQLDRLATAVLSKSREDLVALAETNPHLFREWSDAFRQEKLRAESEARRWSSAMAALATALPAALAAAE